MPQTRRFVLVLVAAFAVLLRPSTGAAPSFSDWTPPVTLGAVVNSAWDDALPELSKDGLSLYFTSNRPEGSGSYDIWVTQRDDDASPWGSPRNLGPTINGPTSDAGAALSRDGHWLFFHSIRPDGYGGYDLMASWRPHTHDDFGWQTPFNLGPTVNSAFNDAGPSYLADGGFGSPQLYFASDRPGGFGSWDLYVTDIGSDGTFGPPALVAGLNTSSNDQKPAIRFDGLEMFFFSGRPGSLAQDIWSTTRRSVFDEWTPPTNVTAVNTASNDVQCAISADRRLLIITSNRPGGLGATDLYMSSRTR